MTTIKRTKMKRAGTVLQSDVKTNDDDDQKQEQRDDDSCCWYFYCGYLHSGFIGFWAIWPLKRMSP